MKIRNIVVYTALAAMVMLFAVPVNARFAHAYSAEIHATGTLTLFGMISDVDGFPDRSLAAAEDGIELPIDATFMATVPTIILAGEYDTEFHGFAAARVETIKFTGILKVDLDSRGINFWVQFAYAKPEEVADGPYSVNGTLHITISESTPTEPEVTWVLMKGQVEKFDNGSGDVDAFGGLIAHVKKGGDNEWTRVQSTFSLEPAPLSEMKLTPGTYNRDFYIITLTEATKTELNNGDYDLYIEGVFNVHKRTVTITVEDSEEVTITVKVEPIAEGKNGYLQATYEPSAFTLHIDDFGDLTGEVTFFHAKHAKPFELGLPRGDFNKDRRVNIEDIVRIAKAFRARLGETGYNFDLDVNPDFEINVVDLAVTAKEFGQEY